MGSARERSTGALACHPFAAAPTPRKVEADRALLVHPAAHFFAGFGPSPGSPTVSNRETVLGAGAVVGGWL